MTTPSDSLLSPSLAAACRDRRIRLAALLQASSVDALLLTAEKDIHYLTGFVGHESVALVLREPAQQGDGAIIVSDSRYDEYLQPWRARNAAEIVMGTRHRLNDSIKAICQNRGIRRLGIQADAMTVVAREALAAAVGEERLVNTNGVVASLRMRKDALEIETLERAIAIAQDGLAAALNHLEPGMSEAEFSARLEFEMKTRGGEGAAFTPIIGAGANSSIIHHGTGSTAINEGVLLIDWGSAFQGLNSDLTRTFGLGELSPKLREVYDVVLHAQLAAIDAIRPGRTCAEIDAVARDVITQAGYGEFFGHGLGHGLGMDVHEGPYFNALQTDVRLEPGFVMTVEPGVYLPGVGGVRIEDDIVVTDSGCRVLSDYPKDYPSALLEPAVSRSHQGSRS